jgi:serine/threonine protein kinase
MQYLHRGFEGRGKEPIIHRDLKPENIMVYSILTDRIALELDTKDRNRFDFFWFCYYFSYLDRNDKETISSEDM